MSEPITEYHVTWTAEGEVSKDFAPRITWPLNPTTVVLTPWELASSSAAFDPRRNCLVIAAVWRRTVETIGAPVKPREGVCTCGHYWGEHQEGPPTCCRVDRCACSSFLRGRPNY